MSAPSPEEMAIMATQDLGSLTKNIIYAFTILAFVSVILRMYTRLRYQAAGWEDYTIIVAMLFAIATGVCQVLQVNAGNGKHAYFITSLTDVELILEYLFWSIVCYNISLTCIKVSIILQYRRIFTVREMRLPLNITLGICIAWGICTFFTSVFTCVPVDAYWRIAKKPTAKCLKDENLWFSNAAINICTDLLVAILPVKVIWSLHIPKRQKIALLGILTIGWFVCVVSVLRLHALIVLSHHPDDRTYYSAATAYWSSIEMNLGIVCASLPALKPLIVKIIPAFSTRGSSRGYGAAYGGPSGKSYGLGSRSTRQADVELASKPVNSHAYSGKGDQNVTGKSIYVTQQFEQHFEEQGHTSDNESQKDLVANTVPRSKR